jgi:hypothetical protein
VTRSIDPIKMAMISFLLSMGLCLMARSSAMTKSFAYSAKVSVKGSQGKKLEWLDGYSGQTVEQILSLEGKYRIDSLVLAFEQAIGQKAAREGENGLTNEERVVLAVEALEREVNNGGYAQFFKNSSREFASTIVNSLRRIGCTKAATITQKATEALGISDLTAKAIETVMATDDKQRGQKLSRCDGEYYKNTEPIAERLFAFIRANKAAIRL